MTADDALKVMGIACLVGGIGMLATRRVIVAWLVFLSVRRQPVFRHPRARRWLWLMTLAYADGLLTRDRRRAEAARRRARMQARITP